MMNLFRIGDPVPDTYKAASIPLGRGRTYTGPGGIALVARVDRPTQPQVAAANQNEVGLGVHDRRDGKSALVLQIGEPGTAGDLEVLVDTGSELEGWDLPWWGENIELALCDERTIVRSVVGFVGVGRSLGGRSERAVEALKVSTAVFPDQCYGIVQPRGLLDVDAWVESARALVHTPTWKAGFSEVWDVRRADEIVLTATDIARLVRLEVETKSYLEGSKSYVVMPPRHALSFSAKFYAQLVRHMGRKVIVCHSAEEAAQLLGIGELPILNASDPAESE